MMSMSKERELRRLRSRAAQTVAIALVATGAFMLTGCGKPTTATSNEPSPIITESTISEAPSSDSTTTTDNPETPSATHDLLMDFDPMVDAEFPPEIQVYRDMSYEEFHALPNTEAKSYAHWRYEHPIHCDVDAPNEWPEGFMPGWQLAINSDSPIKIAKPDNTPNEILRQFIFEQQVALESCNIIRLDEADARKMVSGYSPTGYSSATDEQIDDAMARGGGLMRIDYSLAAIGSIKELANGNVQFPVRSTDADGTQKDWVYTFQYEEFTSTITGEDMKVWNIISAEPMEDVYPNGYPDPTTDPVDSSGRDGR